MEKTEYIQTDANTKTLVEVLLQEIKDLKAQVCRLNPPDSLRLLSEDEAAIILHISKRTLVLLRNEHKIHYHKIESRILYSLEDIREFEDNCKK